MAKDDSDRRESWVAETKHRLREAMAAVGVSQRSLDQAVGLQPGATGALFSKGDLVNWWRLRRIAEHLKTTPGYLLGVDEARASIGHFEAGGEAFSTLPVLVEVAAGVPRFAPDDGEPLRLAFRTSWLQQLVGTVDERYVYLARVKGDSMHPTIRDGNVILVQRWYPPPLEERARGVPWIENGAIYLLQEADGDGQTVKRLALADDHLTVYADNPAFAPYSIDLAERDARGVILGRARWIGQKEG